MRRLELRESDRRRQVEILIETSPHTYQINVEGTVDGFMTRMPAGRAAWSQGFQPNLFTRIRNLGPGELTNPWIIINDERDFRTVDSIVAEATHGAGSDLETARMIFEHHRRHRFHATTWDKECMSTLKVYNVFGYTLCLNDRIVLAELWRSAGLSSRPCRPTGHEVAEVRYAGAYHLFDGDHSAYFLKRDNRTVASEADIIRDHDLIKRTHTGSILAPDNRLDNELYASMFTSKRTAVPPEGGPWPHRMELVLRPGESIEWRFDHVGKQYSCGREPNRPGHQANGEGELSAWSDDAYASLRNGLLRYAPDLSSPSVRRGLLSEQGISIEDGQLRATKGAAGTAVWQISSPYVVVGGSFSCRITSDDGQGKGRVRLSISVDGTHWRQAWSSDKPSATAQVSYDSLLSPAVAPRGATYRYLVRLELTGDRRIETPVIETHVQMAPLAMPELRVGSSSVRYSDSSPGPRLVEVVHAWIERNDMHPPEPPMMPVAPVTHEGTTVELTWQAPADPDGDTIVDYHLQVSDDPQLRWPLSPSFDKLMSRAATAGEMSWQVPTPGLLNPGQTYYWRVRAMDATGLWSEWSRTGNFSCLAPGVPEALDVELTAGGDAALTWQASPIGRKPFAYKVYGSNEKGFTASDTPYEVFVGQGFCSIQADQQLSCSDDGAGSVLMPANLMARTRTERLTVAGPSVQGSAANKAYYRVVSVDAQGNESGPSDYAEIERPFIYTHPPLQAEVGVQYRYRPGVIRSDGDLGRDERLGAAFWDREKVSIAIVDGPSWLTVDPSDDAVSGAPDEGHLGLTRVEIEVILGNNRRTRQSYRLRVVRAGDPS
jgi:hypothetical protein